MRVIIPNQLMNDDCRFIRLRGRSKIPLDFDWTTENNFEWRSVEIQEHIVKEQNVGFLCGSGNIYVIDIDDRRLFNKFSKIIGKTLTIQTPHGYHFYFKYPTRLSRIILERKEGEEKVHIGELQGVGTQVVLPGSKNRNGRKYKLYESSPIVELSEEKLNLIIQRYGKVNRTFTIQPPNWENYNQTPLSNKISITSLVDMTKMKHYREEFYGPHPIHGSTTGMNFFINPSKNFWHCYRCDSGGDALAYIAVKEGICSCEDFGTGGKKLRGEDFKRALRIAKEKYNLVLDDRDNYVSSEFMLNPQLNQLRIITDTELSNMEIEETEYYVQDLVPKESLVLVVGKSRSMKSMITTAMSFSACWGQPFLSRFLTEQTKILYIDSDNPKRITQSRNILIRRGLGVPATEDFGYLIHSGLKITKDDDLLILKGLIQDFGANIVVLDSLIRFLDRVDENMAGDMSEVFTRLRQLSSELNVTFIIIHHMNKTPDRRGIDRVRGSSDIVNAVDVVLLFDREETNSFIKVTQEKNRFDSEIGPFIVLPESDHEENKLSFSITTDMVETNNRFTRAARIVLDWLLMKEWEDSSERIFTTAEAKEYFRGEFNNNDELNRKIIQGALRILIENSKIERVDRGEYKLIADTRENEEGNEDGQTEDSD
jgi:archaellum biogenesis ATPase FlaH